MLARKIGYSNAGSVPARKTSCGSAGAMSVLSFQSLGSWTYGSSVDYTQVNSPRESESHWGPHNGYAVGRGNRCSWMFSTGPELRNYRRQ